MHIYHIISIHYFLSRLLHGQNFCVHRLILFRTFSSPILDRSNAGTSKTGSRDLTFVTEVLITSTFVSHVDKKYFSVLSLYRYHSLCLNAKIFSLEEHHNQQLLWRGNHKSLVCHFIILVKSSEDKLFCTLKLR